ncbi:MAG TPA: SurA N-terminal domain-containing protein [Rhodocyclaceae bacterium]|nr:SurA N-terminal domain-containing protein [Rhodocyclaceae bacterium]
MLESVRNNKKIAQVILGLIALTFVFFGVGDYVRDRVQDTTLAHVGDTKVTQQQFQQALREQSDRLRSEMKQEFDPKMLESPEARLAILNNVIDQRLLHLETTRLKMQASNEAVKQAIATDPEFQGESGFSQERYQAKLNEMGKSAPGFEAEVRQSLSLRQLGALFGQSGIVSKTTADRVLAIQTQKRHVAEYRFPLDQYLGQVKLAPDAARKFYDENQKRFEMPEQARAEFVILSQDAIATQVAVTDDQIKAWYDSHKGQYSTPEERRASHILIDPKKSDKAKAKARAEELLQQVQKAPASFADLARKNSDDSGSKDKGGDLGFFGRGAMLDAFERTAFKLKEGEISEVVESEAGFHIIKLTGLRAAKEKPLTEVRADIEAELRRQAAARKFAEAAEQFNDLVYEQSDSLKPAAEKFKLTVQQTPWLTRELNPAYGPLANEKLLQALFSADAVKDKRNTPAVEIGQNTLVAARILEHKPAALQPFDGIKPAIEAMLRRQEALALAKKAGEAQLAALQKGGPDKLNWPAVKTVTRLDPRLLPQPAVQPVFKLDPAKLPAYTGVELPDAGYALFKLSKVEDGEAMDAARRDVLVRQLSSFTVQQEVQTYLAALRARYKVDIDKTALEVKDK